jgi:hypothetical protein
MPLRHLVSCLVLGFTGLALCTGAQWSSGGWGPAQLKGHTILEAGTIRYRSAGGHTPEDPQGQTLEWYEFVLTPGQTRVYCFTFATLQVRLLSPHAALALLDAQRLLKVAVLQDDAGGMTVRVEPIRIVMCPR